MFFLLLFVDYFVYISHNSMSKSSTPKRNTRSNSSTSDKSSDIPALLVKMKQEIIEATKAEIKNVVDKLSQMELKISCIENALDCITLRQDTQEKQIADLNDRLDNFKSTTASNDMLEELQMRMARSRNVIVSGLPEQSDGTADERRKKDEDDVERLLEKIEMSDALVEKVSRLGKISQERSRLVRVSFREEEEKTQTLRKARLLRSFEKYRGVFVNPDRTPSQQKHFTKLRQELKVRRENGEDVIIFRDRIVSKADMNASKNFRR